MVELEYIGKHQPENMIVDVKNEKARELIDRGDFKLKGKKIIETKKPSMKWTEKEIKQWIVDNKVNVKYSIHNDTKKEILDKLEKGGYL